MGVADGIGEPLEAAFGQCMGELAQALAARGFERFSDAVGFAHRPAVSYVPEEPDPVGDAWPDHLEQGDRP